MTQRVELLITQTVGLVAEKHLAAIGVDEFNHPAIIIVVVFADAAARVGHLGVHPEQVVAQGFFRRINRVSIG